MNAAAAAVVIGSMQLHSTRRSPGGRPHSLPAVLGTLIGIVVVTQFAPAAIAGPRVTCDEVRRVRALAAEQGLSDRTLATLELQTCRPAPPPPPPPPSPNHGRRGDGDRHRGGHGRGGHQANRINSAECSDLDTLRLLHEIDGGRRDDNIDALALLMCEFGGTQAARYANGTQAQYSFGWNWPNGKAAKRSFGWDYPNGKAAIRSFGFDWPSGKAAKRSFGWDYPNGRAASRSFGWSLPGGERAGTERDALIWACQRVGPKACRRQMDLIGSLNGDTREAAVVAFLWRASGR